MDGSSAAGRSGGPRLGRMLRMLRLCPRDQHLKKDEEADLLRVPVRGVGRGHVERRPDGCPRRLGDDVVVDGGTLGLSLPHRRHHHLHRRSRRNRLTGSGQLVRRRRGALRLHERLERGSRPDGQPRTLAAPRPRAAVVAAVGGVDEKRIVKVGDGVGGVDEVEEAGARQPGGRRGGGRLGRPHRHHLPPRNKKKGRRRATDKDVRHRKGQLRVADTVPAGSSVGDDVQHDERAERVAQQVDRPVPPRPLHQKGGPPLAHLLQNRIHDELRVRDRSVVQHVHHVTPSEGAEGGDTRRGAGPQQRVGGRVVAHCRRAVVGGRGAQGRVPLDRGDGEGERRRTQPARGDGSQQLTELVVAADAAL
mmetsp:Transcript_19210/g.60444  ORF Transcript_19210/g.60444 Transcript_19210/m.60444 type:complete len:363 (-) Transcript_19210:412-1500(-)